MVNCLSAALDLKCMASIDGIYSKSQRIDIIHRWSETPCTIDLQKVNICCTILSLTVVRRKNRCIPCVYWGSAIFAIVLKYSNLFLPFTFFLYGFHFAFCYKLIVCSKTTAFMKCIRNLFAFIQWDESLFLYFCKIHCL